MRVSLHDSFILVEIGRTAPQPFLVLSPPTGVSSFCRCFCFFCLLRLHLLLHSFSFYIVFHVIVQLTFSVCNSFQNNEKKYFSSIGCMFSYYRRLMFSFAYFVSSLLFVCFRTMCEWFCVSACCWFVSENSLFGHYAFYFVLVWF